MPDASPHDDEVWTGPVADAPDPRPVRSSTIAYDGAIWQVRVDDVDFDGQRIRRDMLVHPGAVVVLAIDDAERVLLVRQYRHAVGMMLFEAPAGLLDRLGEDPLATAQRELAEEAGYEAREWNVLLDLLNSPGGSSESIRIYLARDVHELPDGRIRTNEAEEMHLPRVWVPLDEARDLVLGGQMQSPSVTCGVLAACAARSVGWTSLRPADAPWTAREHLAATGRVHELDRLH